MGQYSKACIFDRIEKSKVVSHDRMIYDKKVLPDISQIQE